MLQYLIKFSISLAVLYIFYRAILRPLTFYQWNRFYLLCYSLLSFVIPFIDISPYVSHSSNQQLVNVIPAVPSYNFTTIVTPTVEVSWIQRLTVTDWLLITFCTGVIIMLVKLFAQFISLRKIRRGAVLLNEDDNVQLYETTATISPFSFGNAIYFNRSLHTEEELQRIVQHEFVHVKQKHTVDLLIGEALCVVNWFNPFAWFIRYSIRQNLEFIADNNVVANGLDKKEYQYLLLKVIGIPQYSIANNFNFSNLKKRIAMMNKMKSAKLQLTKFLFVLPLLAVLLLAFRNKLTGDTQTFVFTGIVYDAKTAQPLAGVGVNEKYSRIAAITDANGFFKMKIPIGGDSIFKLSCNFYVAGYLSKDDQNSSFSPAKVKTYADLVFVGMRQQNNASYDGLTVSTHYQIPVTDEKQFIADPDYSFVQQKFIAFQNEKQLSESESVKYSGDTIPPPPPPVPVAPVTNEIPANPATPSAPQVNHHGYTISIADNQGECVVLVKDKSQKIVKAQSLVDWNKNKKENENKYGEVPPPPPPLAPIVADGAVSKSWFNNSDATKKPLFVIDGIIQPENFAPNSIDANKISSVNVLKGQEAIAVYGDKAKNGAVFVITGKGPNDADKKGQTSGFNIRKTDPNKVQSVSVLTDKLAPNDYSYKAQPGPVQVRQMRSMPDAGNIPKDVLVIIDGVEATADYNLNNLKGEDIKVINLRRGKDATDIYGDKGKHNVLEVTTKKYALEKRDNTSYKADSSVRMHFDQFIVNGSITSVGNESIIDGAFSFETKTERPLIVFDDHEFPEMITCSPRPGRYKMVILNAKEAVAKYGDKGKNGAIEITTIKSSQLKDKKNETVTLTADK